MLKDAIQSRYFEQDALSMSHLSKVIRKEMIEGKSFKFSGTFPPGCQESAVPNSLKLLVSMLLYGPNIKEIDRLNSKACLTICPRILFNCKGKVRCGSKKRHVKDREPPLPLYIGLDIHTTIAIEVRHSLHSFMTWALVSVMIVY